MTIRLHPHARQRMKERGATRAEVEETVRSGRRLPAKFSRVRFVRRFPFGRVWHGRHYGSKEIEAIAAAHGARVWLVITVIVRFF